MRNFITGLVVGGALIGGALFYTTHHTETVKDSCYYSSDAGAELCDFEWVGNN